MHIRAPLAAAALFPLLIATSAHAVAHPRLMARAPGTTSLLVLADKSGWWLERGAERTPLRLPAGARAEIAAPLRRGWVVAGTQSVGGRSELFVLGDTGSGATTLSLPAAPAGYDRERPVPVVAHGQLAGLAWLEGRSRETYAVLWAPWTASGFGAETVVAPPGPGSQLALSAASLADGSTLLVWAGFDGEDDEIWGSVGTASGWSTPVRVGVDNHVPDITPAVTPTAAGALVAWSRFDGSEYRLALARFGPSGFHELTATGPPGSLYPSFESGGDSPCLLWRDARADLWTLGQMSEGDRLVVRASAPGSIDLRPAVAVEGRRAIFLFGSSRTERTWE